MLSLPCIPGSAQNAQHRVNSSALQSLGRPLVALPNIMGEKPESRVQSVVRKISAFTLESTSQQAPTKRYFSWDADSDPDPDARSTRRTTIGIVSPATMMMESPTSACTGPQLE